jgi:hypothetical protein
MQFATVILLLLLAGGANAFSCPATWISDVGDGSCGLTRNARDKCCSLYAPAPYYGNIGCFDCAVDSSIGGGQCAKPNMTTCEKQWCLWTMCPCSMHIDRGGVNDTTTAFMAGHCYCASQPGPWLVNSTDTCYRAPTRTPTRVPTSTPAPAAGAPTLAPTVPTHAPSVATSPPSSSATPAPTQPSPASASPTAAAVTSAPSSASPGPPTGPPSTSAPAPYPTAATTMTPSLAPTVRTDSPTPRPVAAPTSATPTARPTAPDCQSGTFYDANAGTCTACSACLPTSYESAPCTPLSDTECQSCAAPCWTCANSATSCLSCTFGHFLSGSTCQSCRVCPAGQYEVQACAWGDTRADTICAACDLSRCAQCSDAPTHCTACAAGLVLHNYRCVARQESLAVGWADPHYILLNGTAVDCDTIGTVLLAASFDLWNVTVEHVAAAPGSSAAKIARVVATWLSSNTTTRSVEFGRTPWNATLLDGHVSVTADGLYSAQLDLRLMVERRNDSAGGHLNVGLFSHQINDGLLLRGCPGGRATVVSSAEATSPQATACNAQQLVEPYLSACIRDMGASNDTAFVQSGKAAQEMQRLFDQQNSGSSGLQLPSMIVLIAIGAGAAAVLLISICVCRAIRRRGSAQVA